MVTPIVTKARPEAYSQGHHESTVHIEQAMKLNVTTEMLPPHQ